MRRGEGTLTAFTSPAAEVSLVPVNAVLLFRKDPAAAARYRLGVGPTSKPHREAICLAHDRLHLDDIYGSRISSGGARCSSGEPAEP